MKRSAILICRNAWSICAYVTGGKYSQRYICAYFPHNRKQQTAALFAENAALAETALKQFQPLKIHLIALVALTCDLSASIFSRWAQFFMRYMISAIGLNVVAGI